MRPYSVSIAVAVALLVAACGGTESNSAARMHGLTTTATTPTEKPATTEAATRTRGTGNPVITTGANKAATTTTSAPVSGTRENPIPAGEPVQVGDWEIRVLSAIPDATDTVMSENEFNDPPQPDHQFYLVEVSATYRGQESDLLTAGISFNAVGDSALAYDYSSTCWIIPDPIDEYTEVFPGGTVHGNLCWEVATADAGSLELIVEPSFSFEDGRSFMEIPPAGTAFDPPPPATTGVNITTPYGIGDAVRIENWEITVISVTPDATDAVLAENQFNEPPRPDHQFYLAEIAATYVGDESEALALGPSISAVGSSAVAYSYNAACGVVPDPVDDFTEVFPGGTVRGNLCWEVASADADALVLIIDPFLSFEAGRVYVNLG